MCQQLYPSNATYGSYFICRYQTPLSVYIPYWNSLQSIIWPKVLLYIHFTLLAYAPEQIYLPHHTYRSHCTNTLGLWTLHSTAHISKKKQTATFNYQAITICLSTPNMPLKCHIYATCTNYFMCRNERTMSVYIPHMNSQQLIMWPKALVCIHFNILVYAPEEICMLHCRYMSHCTSSVVYI